VPDRSHDPDWVSPDRLNTDIEGYQLSTLEWAVVVFQSAQHESTQYIQAIDLAQSLKQMKRLQTT
jgi:hypothetical protein